MEFNNSMISNNAKLVSLNNIFFQDHLFISTIETSIILLLSYYIGYYRVTENQYNIHRLMLLFNHHLLYLYYIITNTKNSFSKTNFLLFKLFLILYLKIYQT